MRNKLFPETPKSVKISTGKWVRILPDEGEGYALYDPIAELDLGRILFDTANNWIYDGDLLSVIEQEELAGAINGHEKKMDDLLERWRGDDGTAMFFPRGGTE
ncbi:hypothetical protein FO440_09620 [Mucilaginibacter corticis]|uniref:Uncharacterized protein n=1 Tax=Mucilaginibacter corticis TaxID=2597670 RepID=A0A556MWV9_9SPHI|nr:hypothetical protein [Mucilaginibacter corticis]TSJ44416.1 hypothetical protein FO440_09620 [Mucilaginibacter corticis]